MKKIKNVVAEHAGGTIWIFHGETEDGCYFLTDNMGETRFLDADPGADFEEACFAEWQQEHLVETLETNSDRLAFCEEMLNLLKSYPYEGPEGRYMTKAQIEAYMAFFRETLEDVDEFEFLMEFDDFCRKAVEEVGKHMTETQPKLQELENGVVGLAFTNEDGPTPFIPLEPFYEEYRTLKPDAMIFMEISNMAKDALKSGAKIKKQMDIFVNSEMDWEEEVKKLLFPRAIGVERNGSVLRNVPHRKYGDIALVYSIVPRQVPFTVLFSNEMLKQYGVTEEELYTAAMENVSGKVMCINIKEMLDQLSDNGDFAPTPWDEIGSSEAELYALKFQEGMPYGAASILCPDIIERLAKRFPEGFYVLPSSTEEVLIAPKKGNDKPREYLEALVREVNSQFVNPKDILSDYVSEYDPASKEMIWGDAN